MSVLPQVQACFDSQGLMKTFGAVMTEGEGGRCVIEVPFDDKLCQQGGLFHGGLQASIADAACGHAAYTLMPADHDPLSVEFKMNLLAPAKGELLRATAQVIKPGRTLSIVTCRVDVLRDGEFHHVAEMLATMFGKAPRGDKA
jgi:uncharacterized protein (TIGR00369 family)